MRDHTVCDPDAVDICKRAFEGRAVYDGKRFVACPSLGRKKETYPALAEVLKH